MRLGLSLLAAALTLAGCAGGMGEPATPSGPPNLFLSPSGEPFRRGPQAPDPVAAWFTQADADGDGRLTLAEFTADALRFFAMLDPDRNGRVDAFEGQRYEREIVPEFGMDPFGARAAAAAAERAEGGEAGAVDDIIRLPDRGLPPRRGRAAEWGSRAASLTGDPQPVRAADADLSQTITQAEFQALAERHFSMLDADRDGALTRATLPPATLLHASDGLAGVRGRRAR